MAMKESPNWARIQERMQPGRLTLDGMLGSDTRPLPEIIEADDVAVKRLGVSHQAVAQRLRELQEAARARLGDEFVAERVYTLRAEESRGILVCPFGHVGRYLKCVTFLKHLPTGREIRWTDLGIHMIESHGFYEGRGSPFRLEPEEVVKLLGLPPDAATEPL